MEATQDASQDSLCELLLEKLIHEREDKRILVAENQVELEDSFRNHTDMLLEQLIRERENHRTLVKSVEAECNEHFRQAAENAQTIGDAGLESGSLEG